MARSNRRLTQFAVETVDLALEWDGLLPGTIVAGNTEISSSDEGVQVRLFDKEILFLGFQAGRVVTVEVRSGDFYDSKGRPSRTTRERLNGLLDLLGERGIIPEGTRVFLSEDGSCRVGKGSQCHPLDKHNPAVLLYKSYPQIPDSIIAKGLL